MKTNFLGVVVLLSVLFTGCTGKKNEENAAAPQAVTKAFKITLKAIVKKDDNFSFFYTEDGSTDFTKIQPVWVNVKGNENEQDIVCTLPADASPTEFRIDTGIKPDQENVQIKSITFENNGKSRVISSAELGNFFRADENKCTFDPKTGIVTPIVKDGKKQFPSLYPQEAALGKELEKLM